MSGENGSVTDTIKILRDRLAELKNVLDNRAGKIEQADSVPQKDTGFGWKEERPNTWVESEMLRIAHLAEPELYVRLGLALKDLREWASEARTATEVASMTLETLQNFSDRVMALANGEVKGIDTACEHVEQLGNGIADIEDAFDRFTETLTQVENRIRNRSLYVENMSKAEFDKMAGIAASVLGQTEPTVFGVPVSKIGKTGNPVTEQYTVLAGLEEPETDEPLPPVEEPILQELVFARTDEPPAPIKPTSRIRQSWDEPGDPRWIRGEVMASGNGESWGGEGKDLTCKLAFTPIRAGFQIREVDLDGNVYQTATHTEGQGFLFDPPGEHARGRVSLENGFVTGFRFANPVGLGHYVKAFYQHDLGQEQDDDSSDA